MKPSTFADVSEEHTVSIFRLDDWLGLPSSPDDGNGMFLRNFSELLPDYTALHARI
jgi:hypothetical protein